MGPTTHVANGSDHGIFAMVTNNPGRAERASEEFSKHGDEHNTYGFKLIMPGAVVPFATCEYETVYVTVFYQEGVRDERPGPPQLVCKLFPVEADRSVIVGKDNQIHLTVYGELWVAKTTRVNHAIQRRHLL